MYRKSLFTKAEFINAKLNYKIQVYGCKIRKKQNSKQVIFFARKNTNNSRNQKSQKTPSRAPYLREPLRALHHLLKLVGGDARELACG